MARKVTPEQRITIAGKVEFTCDRCGARADGETGAFADGARVVTHWWTVGYDGASGGGSREYDLCGTCLSAFEAWMKRKPEKEAAK